MSINPRACWDSCLQLIKENVSEQQFNTWFRPLVFESYKPAMKTLLVQVPSPFVYEYLEEHYVDLLKKVLTRVYGDWRTPIKGASEHEIVAFDAKMPWRRYLQLQTEC